MFTSSNSPPLAVCASLHSSIQLLALAVRLDSEHPHSSAMKPQVATAALCLVLLVASEVMVTSQAAGCDIFQLVPCMAASKNANVRPSQQCCSNIAKMGKGLPGAKCLCSLLSHPLAKSQGVVPRIALGIPQKCRILVPRGFVCQGIRVPGS